MIAVGTKTIETRKWYNKYRGPLLIHSSQEPPIRPAGCVIAIANLVDVRKMTEDDEGDACVKYNPRLYAFVLNKIWKLPEPFKMSGALYIYDADEIYNAPKNKIAIVESAYIAGCWRCEHANMEKFGKGSICSKNACEPLVKSGEAVSHEHAKKTGYRLVKVDLMKG